MTRATQACRGFRNGLDSLDCQFDPLAWSLSCLGLGRGRAGGAFGAAGLAAERLARRSRRLFESLASVFEQMGTDCADHKAEIVF